MPVIEVENKDVSKVFDILLNNGRFTGLPDNRFKIDEHFDEVLEKIKKAGINPKVLNES